MEPAVWIDVAVFLGFIVAVVATGIMKSRHEGDSESYFLAGRGLTWYLIGFSLIAANISTEQFVGQSGQAATHVGLAIASYEWLAAITLVLVAFLFLPVFLRAGIFTIPEFLEYRFSHLARTIMSVLMLITYVCVTLPAVIYSGAKTGEVVFGENTLLGMPINVALVAWILGVLAAIYVVAGGLKACAWADLLQGSALIAGGAIVLVLAMNALGKAPVEELSLPASMAGAGPFARFSELAGPKLHMVLPASDPIVPWTALILGLWVPNIYYWGFNQYIMQRTLGSKSLSEGQKGVIFAAGLKLLIPFIIIVPGIIAFELFKSDMKADAAQKSNPKTLERFDAVKTAAETSQVAFPFDASFAELYPDRAVEVAAFNRRAAGIPMPEGASSLDVNNAAMKGIRAFNKSAAAADRIEIQNELIGYQYDSAFGLLLKKLVPTGLFGFLIAAILGAVTSTLAAMLNAASTIFTMDLYKPYVRRAASQANLVFVGRISVVACMAIACWIAPYLGRPEFRGIFTFIQEFQGFISPGIVGAFVFGIFVRRAPRSTGTVSLLLSPAAYGLLMYLAPDIAFLDRIAIAFGVVFAALTALTLARPMEEPARMPTLGGFDLRTSRAAAIGGAAVVAATVALYVIFW
jgi:SSS family solute:Na+ symporter